MRAMWHYIVFGRTLQNHYYRGLKDTGKSFDVEQFILERLEESQVEDMNISSLEDNDNEPDIDVNEIEEEVEKEVFTESDINSFKTTWEQFGEKMSMNGERQNK